MSDFAAIDTKQTASYGIGFSAEHAYLVAEDALDVAFETGVGVYAALAAVLAAYNAMSDPNEWIDINSIIPTQHERETP